MKLKTAEYKTIEIAEDEEFGMVVGNIVMDGGKMLYAEIVDSTICDHEELANARAFLDKVEEVMETGTVPTILNGNINIETLPDKFRSVVQQRDADITEYIKSICTERIDHVAEKAAINREHAKEMRKKNAIIEELKDQNICDLRELYDIYEAEINHLERELAMRDIPRMKESLKAGARIAIKQDDEITALKSELCSVKSNRDITYRKDRNVIAKLQGDIRSLEAELSTRKEDSDVLMKVVEIVKKWEDDMHWDRTVMKQIVIVVKDYVDASEEPPEHHAIWEQEIVIPGNTSYTVEINSRCE